MNDNEGQTSDAEAAASHWHSRLKSLPVSRQTLDEFFAWRRVAGNQAAFDAVERLYARAGQIADSPAIFAATQAAFDRGIDRRHARANGTAWAAAFAAVLLAGGAWWVRSPAEQNYATQIGEVREIALVDGSRVMLDTDTKMTVRFTTDARRVQLSGGRAYFTVAHNAAQPFIVEAGSATVVATGTRFDVRLIDGQTAVTLVQGGVDVTPADGVTSHLKSGQRLRISNGQKPSVETVDTAIATAWTHDRIVLDNVTLSHAIEEINRYASKPIRLDAPQFASRRFSGSLTAGDVQGFVAAVTSTLPIRAVGGADGSVHLVE